MSWFRDHYIQIRNTLIGVIMVAIVLFVWYGVGKYRERRAVEELAAMQTEQSSQLAAEETFPENAGSETLQTEEPAGDEPVLTQSEQLYLAGLNQKEQLIHQEDDTVVWQDKTYRRNSYMKAILCMGVDRSDTMTGTRKVGEAGQADGLFLIAQDTARNQIRILMIPRDTMTMINETDDEGNDLGWWLDHLTLAFGFGDGSTDSCERMTAAVSDLLCDLEIDHYLAVNTAVIADLNDAVGGVTVTIPTEGMEKKDPAFIMGSQVTLHGSQAEAFVRYRDIEKDNSAINRMDQHKEYIRQYFQTLQEKSREDSNIVPELFDRIQDYMVTDMDKAEYLKIAVDALSSSGLDDDSFYVLPGIGITTDRFDEYYVTFNQAIPMILQLFYRETAS
ncbi:MAG: LCP family protein [Clostridiales bacterium]|nr:LCP family protein [Clostridiales bacterium]